MRTRVLATLLAAWSLAAAAGAVAETPPPEPSKEEPAGEEQSRKTESKPKATIFGLVQADAYSGDAGTSGGEDSSFFIRRARLGARGALTERLAYRVMVALDGTNSDTLGGDVRTFDAYIDATLSDRATLRVGQFKYTFDREGRRSAAALPLITRARVTNTLAGRLGRTGGAFRDIGIELGGAFDRWSYAVGMVNGNGTNKRDDNDDKDAYLRVATEPLAGLSVGAGWFEGTAVDAASGLDSDERIATVDALYERGPLAVMAALYAARYRQPGARDVEPEGFYLVGTYRVRPHVELALRYQEFDADSNRPDRGFDSVDAGVTYYFAPKGRWGGLKAAFNYMARSADAGTRSAVWEERGASLTGEADDVFLARLQVAF